MGREIKRVALDFDWPLEKTWEGYLNPFYKYSHECTACGGSGYNPETQQIADDWYDSHNHGVTWSYEYNVGRDGKPATRPPWRIIGHTRAWCHDITQDEVDALIEANRLCDFTHDFTRENGWQRKSPIPKVTAAEVNEWSQHFMGHDAINRNICIRTRAKRLGVYGHCEVCKGEGTVWDAPEFKQKAEDWKPTEPPAGEGWQVWETVSEGSPVTPVFATADALMDYLVSTGQSRRAAEAFCKDGGWVPSMILVETEDGRKSMLKGIEAAVLQHDANEDR